MWVFCNFDFFLKNHQTDWKLIYFKKKKNRWLGDHHVPLSEKKICTNKVFEIDKIQNKTIFTIFWMTFH